MQDVLPTVVIETENGPVIINKSDFDESKHTLAGSTVEQIVADNPPPTLVVSGDFPAAATVVKTGKKFFVVDAAADNAPVQYEGIDAAGYETDAAAWAAVMAAKGAPQA